jgi:hypothetical protein
MKASPAADSLAAHLSEKPHRSLAAGLPPVDTLRGIRCGIVPANKAIPLCDAMAA